MLQPYRGLTLLQGIVFVSQVFLSRSTRTRGVTISGILDKTLSQVSTVLPYGTFLHIFSRIKFIFPTAGWSVFLRSLVDLHQIS